MYGQDALEESLTTTIALREDGSARWSIEERFLLATQEDVSIFEKYLAQFETEKDAYLQNFTERTNALVSRASVITGRSMRAESFQVTANLVHTATASYGTVVYSYDWVGFAKVEAKRLAVGDVFEGGFYLYQGDTLIVQYPVGYGVVAASPVPDETRNAERVLLWYGRRNFGAGEPTVILEEGAASVGDSFPGYLPAVAIVAVVAVVVGLAVFFFAKRRKKTGSAGVSSLRRLALEKIEEDEEKVVKLLKSAGGKLFQSQISRHYGFSTSKTSELLTSMEKKGLIKRKIQGREKIVTLVK